MDDVWGQIRITRSAPPARARTERARAVTYTAALEQFEQLMHAAAVVGPAARPLPLYYALNQAGRAIVAAHGLTKEASGHGISLKGSDTIMQRRITPHPKQVGLFGAVADATGSERLSGQVELGALWAALPELSNVQIPGSRWPHALRVWARQEHEPTPLISRRAEATVVFETPSADPDEIARWLGDYPAAEGWGLEAPHGVPVITRQTPTGLGVALFWEAERASEASHLTRLSRVAPAYRSHSDRWLRPALGDARNALSPLMTWWALLYGLSMLARYYPAEWVAALAVDASPLAVPLERAVGEALEALPRLVLQCLIEESLTA